MGFSVRGHICIRRKAKDGEPGAAGKSIRTTVWEVGKQVYAGDTQVDGIYPLDIVSDKAMSIGVSGVNFYMCKTSHTTSANIPLTNTAYWTKLNNLKPVVTYLILAELIKANYIDVQDLAASSAFIQSLIVNKLRVKSGNNTILYAGDTSYPLLCGSDQAATAVTKIGADGKIYATAGKIGGWEIGVDPDLHQDALVIGANYDDGYNWTWIQQNKFAINNENGGIHEKSIISPGRIYLRLDDKEIILDEGKISCDSIETEDDVKVGENLLRSCWRINEQSSYTFYLSEDEIVLKSIPGNTAYLNLPNTPKDGQKFEIINAARAQYLIVRSATKNIISAESSATPGTSGGYNTMTYSSIPAVLHVLYDGTEWVTYM